MGLKILLLSSEPDNWAPKELVKVAKERGNDVEIINPDECYIAVTGDPFISFNGTKFLGADVCIPRLSEENLEYKISIMEQLLKMGVVLLNKPKSMRLASNKLESQILFNANGIKTPKAVMLTTIEQLDNALNALDEKFPLIIKTLFGTHGVGVMKIDSKASLKSVIQQLLKSNDEFIIQEYFEHDKSGRMYILNGEVMACVMRSIPKDDFRSNAHQGAELKVHEPTEKEIEVAKKCCEIIDINFGAVDYILKGDDVIVLEVNGSPGFEALQKVVDFPVAEKIIEQVEKMKNHADKPEDHGQTSDEDDKSEEDKEEDSANKESSKNDDDDDKQEHEKKAEEAEETIEPEEDEEPKKEDVVDNTKEKNDDSIEKKVDNTEKPKEQEIDLTHDSDDVIGTITEISIKGFHNDKPIPSRVDTGATHSSINASDIKVDGNTVRFRFEDTMYKFYLYREAKVRTSDNGDAEVRPVIRVDAIINNKIVRGIEFTLNEREHMKYDVIIGRSALASAGVLVDPSENNIDQPKGEEE